MDLTPRIDDVWPEIGGHFDTFTQILCEFLDNSIANYRWSDSEKRSIVINIDETSSAKVKIEVEDAGTGIMDLESSLRFGDKTEIQTALNEHGFGLKHALAAANPENNDWHIYTRIQNNFNNGDYREVSAPYRYDLEEVRHRTGDEPWPGRFNGTGTLVGFSCSRSLFDTLQKGIRGKAGFKACLNYLKEDLGYIYAGVIQEGEVTITITSGSGYHERVLPVVPDWVDYYSPGTGSTRIDLGGGEVEVKYEFGEMAESDYKRYYKRNTSTNGAEIRMNGRIIHPNLFKEIWEKQNHPEYNHFLVRIDLRSEDRGALPKTRTAKTGIRSGDEKLEELFQWIRNTHPNPPKQLSGTVHESRLVERLKKLKESHIRDSTKRIEKNFPVFTTIDPDHPVKVDLYVFDGTDTVLYEAKKNTADVQDLYQLLLYWDGAVSDNLTPTEGILIASDFSPGVDPILNLLNQIKDQEGNNYNFSKKTWRDERVDYPQP